MEPAAAGPRKLPPRTNDLTHAPTAAAAAAVTSATAPTIATPSVAASPASSWLATAASLLAVGLGGAALLVWWALEFHRTNERLWMVPAGLVLLGTPLVAWLSVFASDLCRRRRRKSSPSDIGL